MASIHTNRGIGRARKTRAALGLPPDRPLPDLLEAVETAGGVHVVVLELDDAVAGAYLPRPGLPLVFVNGAQGVARQRFTLAHEFGHHRIGHAAVVDRISALTDTGRDPQEVEANAFAAEFLVPRAAVGRLFPRRSASAVTLEHVVRLATTFGVSAQMARIRLETCGVLDDRRLIERLDREIEEDLHLEVFAGLGLDALDDGLRRACERLPRIPDSLRESAFGQYLAGEIDIPALAAQSGQRVEDMARMLGNLGLDTAPAVRSA